MWDPSVLGLHLWQHHRWSGLVRAIHQRKERSPHQPNSREPHGILPRSLPWKPGAQQTLRSCWQLFLHMLSTNMLIFLHTFLRIALPLTSPMVLTSSSLWSLMTSTRLERSGWIWCWSWRYVRRHGESWAKEEFSTLISIVSLYYFFKNGFFLLEQRVQVAARHYGEPSWQWECWEDPVQHETERACEEVTK